MLRPNVLVHLPLPTCLDGGISHPRTNLASSLLVVQGDGLELAPNRPVSENHHACPSPFQTSQLAILSREFCTSSVATTVRSGTGTLFPGADSGWFQASLLRVAPTLLFNLDGLSGQDGDFLASCDKDGVPSQTMRGFDPHFCPFDKLFQPPQACLCMELSAGWLWRHRCSF